MNILAIETATEGCATGLRTASGLEIIKLVDENRQHTEELTVGIQELLREDSRQVTLIVWWLTTAQDSLLDFA